MKKLVQTLFLAVVALSVFSISSCKKPDDNTTTGNATLSGEITANKTLSADTIYELAGKVVVPNGITLTIEPGTIIKGRTGTGSLASALIIARGGKIMAEGTADKPIIFTSILDNIEVGQKVGSNLGENDREKWGGVIILGRAPISAADGDTEAQIEGIPADEDFGKYGGTNVADNSGVMKYVSIRHGGALIGEGNEINGLTLGGVGNGTTLDHIEIVATLDDGIEFFGGTVNLSNVAIFYQGDDALDIDQNYAGTITNAYVLQGTDTDNALEIDGPENSTYTDGLFTIQNSTFKTENTDARAATFKSKGQGTLTNCAFSGYNSKGVRLRASFDGSGADKSDSYLYFTQSSPKLIITNNEFKTTLTDEISVYTDDATYSVTAAMETAADDKFNASGNTVSSSLNFTKGANTSVFDGWSWGSNNSKF